ncbi:MAG: cytochrome C oxidase subunit IV family protein [Bacteroidetes bacterium]|nr:cytochrome C oxidase subunit IV family protein [Bacteroidota bacterium]
MSSSVDFQEFERHAPDPGAKRDIMKTFWILLGLTIIDLLFYFWLPSGMIKNSIFILLGIVKAYFIVGTFMHLKHERKFLILMLIVPVIFIIALIGVAMYEGHYLFNLHWN